jgi:hypothetical protein
MTLSQEPWASSEGKGGIPAGEALRDVFCPMEGIGISAI